MYRETYQCQEYINGKRCRNINRNMKFKYCHMHRNLSILPLIFKLILSIMICISLFNIGKLIIFDIVFSFRNNYCHDSHNVTLDGIQYNYIEIFGMVDEYTSYNFNKKYNKLKDLDNNILIILETPGGYTHNTFLIENIILSHKNNIGGGFTSFVPDYAYSAGSMISLCSDELILAKDAKLSPIDSQFILVSHMGIHILPIARIGDLFDMDYNDNIPALNVTISKYKYNKDLHDVLFEHFISGKYKHNHKFDVEYLMKIGVDFRVKNTSNSIEKVINNYRENPILCGTNTFFTKIISVLTLILFIILLGIININLLLLVCKYVIFYPINLLYIDIKKLIFR